MQQRAAAGHVALAANDVHALSVRLSKHLYVGPDGIVRNRAKPIRGRLEARGAAEKRVLVHGLLQDVFSGVLAGDVVAGDDELDLVGLLARTWAPKAKGFFQGRPRRLLVSKDVAFEWPEAVALAADAGVRVVLVEREPIGVVDARIWEKSVWTGGRRTVAPRYANLARARADLWLVMRDVNVSPYRSRQRLEAWNRSCDGFGRPVVLAGGGQDLGCSVTVGEAECERHRRPGRVADQCGDAVGAVAD